MAKEPPGRNQLSLPFAMNVSQYMKKTDDFVNLLFVNHKYGRIEPGTRTNPKLTDSAYRVEIIDGSIRPKNPYRVERVFNSLETVSVYDENAINKPNSDISRMIHKVKRVKLCITLDEKKGKRIIQKWQDKGIEVVDDSIKYICDLEYDPEGDGTGMKELDPHCSVLKGNRILEYDANDWRRFDAHREYHLNFSRQPVLDLSNTRIKEIEPYFFLNGNYDAIILPTTLTKLGDYCFHECQIDSITLPRNITSLPNDCFSGCTLSSITLPPYLERIAKDCFSFCKNLISIELPTTLTYIGFGCFRDCNSLRSIDIPDGVTELPTSCFEHCISLANIKLPSKLRSIGNTCFEDCSHLENIVIPDTVTSIGEFCFRYCRMLTSINIPSNITRIYQKNLFMGCTRLENITYDPNRQYLAN